MKSACKLVLLALAVVTSCASASAQTPGITIDINFQEAHRPIDNFAMVIVWDHHLVATLSGRNVVQEQWDNHSNTGFQDAHASESTFGYEGRPYVWHVLGTKKLTRFQEFNQHTMTIDVSVNPNNTCIARVSYRLKAGYTDMMVPRADNHVMAHFTLPKVLSSSCAIR